MKKPRRQLPDFTALRRSGFTEEEAEAELAHWEERANRHPSRPVSAMSDEQYSALKADVFEYFDDYPHADVSEADGRWRENTRGEVEWEENSQPDHLDLQLALRIEAMAREDTETLARLDARRERLYRRHQRWQTPCEAASVDFSESEALERQRRNPGKRRLIDGRVVPRSLPHQQGQPRCPRCRRWVSKCACQTSAGIEARDRHRRRLDGVEE